MGHENPAVATHFHFRNMVRDEDRYNISVAMMSKVGISFHANRKCLRIGFFFLDLPTLGSPAEASMVLPAPSRGWC